MFIVLVIVQNVNFQNVRHVSPIPLLSVYTDFDVTV